MALQVAYTDNTGTTHSEAYGKIQVLKLSYRIPELFIHVSVFHNGAARSKSDSSAIKKEIIQITYRLIDPDFSTYLADSVLLTDSKSLLSQLYTWLKTHNDGPLTHTHPEGLSIPNEGNSINWTTATDV